MKYPIIAIAVFLSACLYPALCSAQDIKGLRVVENYERLDSTTFNNVTNVITSYKDFSRPMISIPNSFQDFKSLSKVSEDLSMMQNLSFHNPYSVEDGIMIQPVWRAGAFVASGNTLAMPGLMRIESGNIGLTQSIGNFSMYLGGEANKYGYFNSLHTQYGVTGFMEYQFNPRLSVSVFGSYYFGGTPLMRNGVVIPPSMMGYYNVSSFGGTVNYQINETFGLNVGAKYEQQFGTNRYRFSPIVTPTVKIGKVKIGLPVGEILYDYVKSEIERKRFRAKPPVIPPTVKGNPVRNTRS
ncbi:MAG: hypothetical protein K2K58_03745 [Muribaculaceae bacterium]|nr:hypothetical protein [Muribaculaceae bacterium]